MTVDEQIRTWFAEELHDAPDAPSVVDILARLDEVPVAVGQVSSGRRRAAWAAATMVAAACIVVVVGIVILRPSAKNSPDPVATVSPDGTTAVPPAAQTTVPAPTLPDAPPPSVAPQTVPVPLSTEPPAPTTSAAPVAGDVIGTLSIPLTGAEVEVLEGEPDGGLSDTLSHESDTPLPDTAATSGSASLIWGTRYGSDAVLLDFAWLRAGDEIVWTSTSGSTTALRVTTTAFTAPGDDVVSPAGTSLTFVSPHPFGMDGQFLLIHAVATGAPPSGGDVDALVWDDVDDEVFAALAELDSFSGTATVVERTVHPASTGLPDDTSTRGTHRLTMLADGRVWTESTDGGWSSFDPGTGVARLGYVALDGTVKYQEVQGWTDYSTGLMILGGHLPVLEPGVHQPNTPVTETTFEGRPAWEIRQMLGAVIVDQATGIVVRSLTENPQDDGRLVIQESTLVDLEVGTALPDIFPGLFPEGAAVDRSGSPTGALSLTVDEAATRFGRGVVVPPSADASMRITLSESTGNMGSVEMLNQRLELSISDGFVRTTRIEIMKFVPVDDVLPDGWAIVDGEACASTDGVTCGLEGPDDSSVITSGPFAGAPSAVEGTRVTIEDGPWRIVISAVSGDAALDIANSLVRVEPGVS